MKWVVPKSFETPPGQGHRDWTFYQLLWSSLTFHEVYCIFQHEHLKLFVSNLEFRFNSWSITLDKFVLKELPKKNLFPLNNCTKFKSTVFNISILQLIRWALSSMDEMTSKMHICFINGWVRYFVMLFDLFHRD